MFYTLKEYIVRGKNTVGYLKFLVLIVFLAFVLTCISILFMLSIYFDFPKFSIVAIEKYYTPLHFLVWSVFFLMYFNKVRAKAIFFRLTILALIIGVFVGLFGFNDRFKYFSILAIQNVLICFYCMLYFAEQVIYNKRLNFLNQPETWIIGSLFLYTAVTTPMYISLEFLKLTEMTAIYQIIMPLSNLFIIFMHCMIIKSTLVARRNRLGPSKRELEKKRNEELDKQRRIANATRFGFDIKRLK